MECHVLETHSVIQPRNWSLDMQANLVSKPLSYPVVVARSATNIYWHISQIAANCRAKVEVLTVHDSSVLLPPTRTDTCNSNLALDGVNGVNGRDRCTAAQSDYTVLYTMQMASQSCLCESLLIRISSTCTCYSWLVLTWLVRRQLVNGSDKRLQQ